MTMDVLPGHTGELDEQALARPSRSLLRIPRTSTSYPLPADRPGLHAMLRCGDFNTRHTHVSALRI